MFRQTFRLAEVLETLRRNAKDSQVLTPSSELTWGVKLSMRGGVQLNATLSLKGRKKTHARRM